MIPQIASTEKGAAYRLPRRLVAALVWATLVQRRRSFARDARRAVSALHPPLHVLGAEHIPPRGPCLVACNHYTRPGFDAWWVALALSAAVAARRAPEADSEIHWVMTAAWTYPQSRWRRRTLTPLTRWAFARVARMYGFVPMPPMPPHPDEVKARAVAVLRTVRLARQIAPQGGMIGLAPEGRDVPGAFGPLPKGAGTFIGLLVGAGLPVLPAGVGECHQADRQADDLQSAHQPGAGGLCVSFGPLFQPQIPSDRAKRDAELARQVAATISRQLP
jgi:1-acyl-sn-glycerol-3-phosphate acyltransferase